MSLALSIERVSKQYRLGTIGYGSLKKDVQTWWARFRGKDDPNARIDREAETRFGPHDTLWALRGVSFRVEQGQSVGIIGRNGAGKTTLLKIISRLTVPTTGTVRIRGRTAGLLAVGTGFNPELSGRDNVFLNGAILGMTRAEVRAKYDSIVDFAGIERFMDTPVKRYSSGMYIRLAFSVAAHLDADILLLDEVLAVGDAEFRGKCLEKMDSLGRAGRTLLFTSHNLEAVALRCPTSLLLEGGRIVAAGNTPDVIQAYGNLTAA